MNDANQLFPIPPVPTVSTEMAARAQERLNNLTKPLGSLGEFEPLLVRLAAIQQRVVPVLAQPHAILFAADHGVAALPVSAYDQKVTEEMAVNICMGTAASSVIARANGVPLEVVDVGICSRVRHPAARVAKVRAGTRDFTTEAAMTAAELAAALQTGWDVALAHMDAGADCLVLGEMGIGNTTSAAALVCALCGVTPDTAVGRGTGISDTGWQLKVDTVQRALALHAAATADLFTLMQALGGYELAALAGAMWAAAGHGVPIVLDGLMVTVAALWAARLQPGLVNYLFASHCSKEPAHQILLDELALTPLLRLGLALGEATGGLFVLPLLQQACKLLAEMATFADARVTNPHSHAAAAGDAATRIASAAGAGIDVAGESPAASVTTIMTAPEAAPTAHAFSAAERAAVYKAILGRRDIRVFLPDKLPEVVLRRILEAGHHGPSVGYMQPWNFIVVESEHQLQRLQVVVERERVRAAAPYEDMRRAHYLRLKVEGITQAPLTLCVTNDSTRGGPHVLGRHTIPETDLMSTSCAIENIWLAARAEGVAIGWVSIYQKADVREILQLPDHIDPVALLTMGYTPHFPDIPMLERVGWGKRIDMEQVVYQEIWGDPKEWAE